MKRLLVLLLTASLLTGCASLPQNRPGKRDEIRDFVIEGRFALRTSLPEQAARSSGGRLTWEHKNRNDRILLANPLGIGAAEIEITPGLARLRTPDGKLSESEDAEALIEGATGEVLPVSRLPGWLLGRPASDGQLEVDQQGRPLRLHEAGWQIEYRYGDDAPDALPTLLTIVRDGNIELKLRIETWQDKP